MSRRNLATIDTDMFTPIGRMLQQAMAHGITNDMLYGGLMVGQTALQGLHAESVIQNCFFGTRRVTWDGRVFRYGKCGETLESMKFFVFNCNPLVVKKSAVVNAAVASATTITLTVSAGSIGVLGKGVIAADELYGGYVSLYNSAGVRDQRMIIGNTALAADGVSITLTLDDGLSLACDASTYCEVCANPYSDLRKLYGGYASAMGLPAVKATVAYHFWCQTWGIARVSPDSDGHHGHVFDQRGFYVDQFGVTQQPETYDGGKINLQYVGFVTERTDSVFLDAAPFVMLQISP